MPCIVAMFPGIGHEPSVSCRAPACSRCLTSFYACCCNALALFSPCRSLARLGCTLFIAVQACARPGFSNMPWLRRTVRCPRSAEPSVARAPRPKKHAGNGCAERLPPPVLRRPAAVINNASKTQFVTPGPRDLHAAMEDWVDAQRAALRERVPGSLARLDAVHRRGLVVTTH